MTNVKTIQKGDKFWCFNRQLVQPTCGTVIALTSNPSKQIGIEFEEPIGAHSCDNRGKDGHCLWTNPSWILTDEEYQAKSVADTVIAASLHAEDIEVLNLA